MEYLKKESGDGAYRVVVSVGGLGVLEGGSTVGRARVVGSPSGVSQIQRSGEVGWAHG